MTKWFHQSRREPRSEWEWEVALVDSDRSLDEVQSVTWRWGDGLLPTTSQSRDRGEGFKAAGRHVGSGYLEVKGHVRFTDGTQGTVRESFLFVEPVRTLGIRSRDWYWGRASNSQGRERPTWLYDLSIQGPDESWDRIRRVVWELGEGWGNKTVPSTERDDSYAISLRGGADPSLVTALVELEDGSTVRLRAALVPFSGVEDTLRVQFYEGSERGDDGDRRYFVTMHLAGPYRELLEVDHVTYRVPQTCAPAPIVEKRFQHGSFSVELPSRATPFARFEMTADLHMRDGSTRRVPATFVPVN